MFLFSFSVYCIEFQERGTIGVSACSLNELAHSLLSSGVQKEVK
jgi:hypothetical protein